MERVLEKDGTQFDQIDSKMIIKAACEGNDPLCLKVVDKFIEIFGVEAGNFALKVFPRGGLYLIGGVTMGIKDRIIKDNNFLSNFTQKGRISPAIKSVPIYLVKEETNVGLMGVEECAFRYLWKLNQDLAQSN
mmetsp:Transcript_5676/g.5177  ORF Transcript_5676/g.5177 Transcript_5676/m.5177 type:complete len:133 (-) Transcript_5676:7-405(-)